MHSPRIILFRIAELHNTEPGHQVTGPKFMDEQPIQCIFDFKIDRTGFYHNEIESCNIIETKFL